MAVPKKIKSLDEVAEAFRGEYKKVGEEFVLDVSGDENLEPLKNANTRLKEERDELRNRLKETEVAHAEYKSKVENIPAIEKSWEKKVDAASKAADTKVQQLTGALHKVTKGSIAESLATKISIAPKFAQARIEARLDVEIQPDLTTKTRVLDKDGKPTALSVDDLEKELVADPEWAPILVGTKASGGGAVQIPTGGAGAGSVLATAQQSLANINLG